jgi:hypothetical protein
MDATIKLEFETGEGLEEYRGVAYGDVGGAFQRDTSYGPWRFIGTLDKATMLADGYGQMRFYDGGTCSSQWIAGLKHGSELAYFPEENGHCFCQYDRGRPVHIAREQDGRVNVDGRECDASDAMFRKLKGDALAVQVGPAPAPAPQIPEKAVASLPPSATQAKTKEVVRRIEVRSSPPVRVPAARNPEQTADTTWLMRRCTSLTHVRVCTDCQLLRIGH